MPGQQSCGAHWFEAPANFVEKWSAYGAAKCSIRLTFPQVVTPGLINCGEDLYNRCFFSLSYIFDFAKSSFDLAAFSSPKKAFLISKLLQPWDHAQEAGG